MKKVTGLFTIIQKMERLKVGEVISIPGSIDAWRVKQNKFHRANPDKRIKVFRENGKAYAGRIK